MAISPQGPKEPTVPQPTRSLSLVFAAFLLLVWIVAACAGGNGGATALSVAISSPGATAYTASDLTVQVTAGGTPDAVELHRDGELLVVLATPYTYVWVTTGDAEGAYELTAVARRGGTQVVSEPRTVVVDRTRPTVIARAPAPNEDNVWIGDPITITFSEPVRSATLTPGTVALDRIGGTPITATLAPSADGHAVTLVPEEAIDVPGELRLTLADAITDLAGNALVTPPPWSWTLPRWHWLGGTQLRLEDGLNVRQARLAVAPDGAAAAAWLEERGGTVPPSDVQAALWDGIAWIGLGGRLNGDDRSGPMYGYQDVAIASDGSVVVAWNSPVSGVPDRLWVHRWDGTTWQPIGGGPVNDPDAVSSAGAVSLVLDEWDRPVVAWYARPGGSYPLSDARVTRWTGAAWVDVGTPRRRNPAHVSFGPVVALDGDGHPVVAWTERFGDSTTYDVFVDRWTGSAWAAIGGSLRQASWASAYVQDLAVGPNGEVVAAMSVTPNDDPRVAIARWSEGGSAWYVVGGVLRSTPDSAAVEPRLEIDGEGRPLVFWRERLPDGGGGYLGRYLLWRYETAVWRDLGFPTLAPSSSTAVGDLAVADGGEVFVAAPWPDEGVPRNHLRVFRYNGVP